jgi:hypothetical protein
MGCAVRLRRCCLALACILLLLCSSSSFSGAEEPLPQTTTGLFLLPMELALYDPTARTDHRSIDLRTATPIVTAALQVIFCSLVQDLILVNEQNQNVCDSNHDNEADVTDSVVLNGNRTAASTLPSILDAAPYSVDILLVQDDRLSSSSWTIWTLHYTILQVGDVYIAEALQNANPLAAGSGGLDIASLAPTAAQSMHAVLQLTLDVNCMDGTMDAWLHQNTTHFYCSPVEEARNKWAQVDAAYQQQSFVPRKGPWYPLRVTGIVLWVLTVLVALGLPWLAARRRKRICARR